jgi:hypothetical protein
MARAKVAPGKGRSKKPTVAQAAPEGGERASVEYVPLIAPKNLKALLKTDGSLRDDISELTDQLREKIAFGVVNQNLDKNAFALLKKFSKMKPEKRAHLWRETVAYMKICGYLEDIEARNELPFDDGAASDEPPAGSEESGGRRAPQFGGTVKQIAAAAGASANDE